MDGGVVVATYSGAMTTECFLALRRQGIGHWHAYAAAVVDVRGVVPLGLCADQMHAGGNSSRMAPPGAFVVNPEQACLWAEYAIAGARLGYARAVFLSYQEALSWARDMALCIDGSDLEPEHSAKKGPSAYRHPLFDPAASQADEPCPTEPAPLT